MSCGTGSPIVSGASLRAFDKSRSFTLCPRSLVPEGMERDQYPFGFGTITGVGRPRRAGYARYSDAVPFRPLAVTISRSTATAVGPLSAGRSAASFRVGD